MICKIVINRIIALIFLSTISSANAGLINTANDSYIDDVTGLEWMDFGVTAGMSYNQVLQQLSEGMLYEDWVTPTFNQVQVLYNGNFEIVDNVYRYNGNFVSVRDPNDRCYWTTCYSEYERLFNTVGQSTTSDYTTGIIMDSQGKMRYVQHSDFNGRGTYDSVSLGRSLYNYDRNENNNYSTLLIKKSEISDVPEPSTLTILALGMIGLASRRFKKK